MLLSSCLSFVRRVLEKKGESLKLIIRKNDSQQIGSKILVEFIRTIRMLKHFESLNSTNGHFEDDHIFTPTGVINIWTAKMNGID